MEVRSKIWLEVNGETVFGSGRRALLEGIDKLGSINKAARAENISFRKALSYIQSMEKRLNMKLVDRKAGGKNGGGAVLRQEAKVLLRKYEQLEDGIHEMLDKKFMDIFLG
jgi:molybdate transport system regulatory protein